MGFIADFLVRYMQRDPVLPESAGTEFLVFRGDPEKVMEEK
ncbi:MAG: hypothetical protein AAEI08_04010 [Gammaproteobacteria bacterium]|jgi:hypothetical protein